MATWFLSRHWRPARCPSGKVRCRPAVEALEGRWLPAQVTEFGTGITAGSLPFRIAAGSDGNLWFTEFGHNALGRITPAGVVTEFALPPGSAPLGIASGPGGLLYFAENGLGRVGRIDPRAGSDAAILASLTRSAVAPSGAGAGLTDITSGPDGNLWFTEESSSRVGKVTPDLTSVQEFPTTTAGAGAKGIVAGPDGALWFTEHGANQIGRITTAGTVTNEFPLTTLGSTPEEIAVGPDGNPWFTDSAGNHVGRITPSGTIREFPLAPNRSPFGITAGPDSNLWFTEAGADRVASISPAGTVVEYGTGITANSEPFGIVTGPDGNLWFTELTANQVGRLAPDLAAAGTPVTAVATAAFSGPVASFTAADPGAGAGDFAVMIDWGDGTPADATSGSVAAVPNQPGHFTVSGTHTYADAGNDTVTVTIADTATGASGTAFSPATVVPFADSAFLSAQETGPSRATAGGHVTYTLTATNAGPADAQDVVVTDVVPDGTTFLSANQLTGPAFTLLKPPVGGTGTFVADPVVLHPGDSATFKVVFLAVTTGPVVNRVTATTVTPNRNNNRTVSTPAPVPVQVTLSASALPDGSPAGTGVGTLTIALPAEFAGQFLPALYGLPAAEADNAAFALASAAAGEVLVAGFRACSTTRASYQVRVHVDVGFGDQVAALPVSIVPGASPCRSGPGVAPVLASVAVVRSGPQGRVQQLVLLFGVPLDLGSAASLSHYTIGLGFTGKGKHRKAITAPLLGATYDPVRQTVTLRLGKLKGGSLRGLLTVEGMRSADGVLGNATSLSVDLRPRPVRKH